ncbi:hypothetical protein [Fictibacillus arsenicus]|uniref:hypothetical protein n=1 Tax=Fictibacillus arsenicus TaxID=255247 RepID=UPI000987C767|nr:hypothetical protein [Fictibacillus arsenicus]
MSTAFKPVKMLVLVATVVAAFMGLVTGSVGFAALLWIVMTPAIMFLAIPMALGNHLSAPRGSDHMEADQ